MAEAERSVRPRRPRGTREDTENELLDAVLRLLERDGVLAGITLREVAKEAGVNHGQIYQYFGNRRVLLRAAIGRLVRQTQVDINEHWDLPFEERRRWMWRQSLQRLEYSRLEAILALDEDPEFVAFASLDQTREALARDSRSGALPPDADTDVIHAVTAAAVHGYAIFREVFARELGIPLDEFDKRSAAVFDHMLAGIATVAASERSAAMRETDVE